MCITPGPSPFFGRGAEGEGYFQAVALMILMQMELGTRIGEISGLAVEDVRDVVALDDDACATARSGDRRCQLERDTFRCFDDDRAWWSSGGTTGVRH